MALGFLALSVAAFVAVRAFDAARDHQRSLLHTYQVESAVTRASELMERAENVRRGYMLTRSPAARATYARTQAELAPSLDRISRLTADNPHQQRALVDVRRLADRILADQAGTNALADAGRPDEALALFRRQVEPQPFVPLRRALGMMLREERRLLDQRAEQVETAVARLTIASGVAATLIALLAPLSLIVLLRYARDLAAKDKALRELNDTLEDQVRERTTDLARANDEIQRFAYIVSHDLRSPLVNVMGFTAEVEAAARTLGTLVAQVEERSPDLMTDDIRLAAREDLPEAVGFIRTSTQKMDRLINAILQLSRQGRRVLTPEPLDLGDVADNVVRSMQQGIEAAGAEVIVRRPLPAITSDRVGVEQLLSNLLENAVKYLQPGRPGRITVSGHEARGRVILAVEDNGRGIAASDHQRIFDLFRRSGAQDRPGEGIGLAHVRALVYRLGGTVDVRSELGQGATFLLNLPKSLDIA